jgi:long-chain acyl-CoA synthetase
VADAERLHPCIHAAADPAKPALIMAGSGEIVTYGELDRRSNQGAHLWRSLGLRPGDVVAVFLDNHPRYLEIAWSAQRSGLVFVCISSRLTAAEAAYIVSDSGAKAVVTSRAVIETAGDLASLLPDLTFFTIGDSAGEMRSWDAEGAALPDTSIADERAGGDMLYSSGTTGRPKGLRGELPANGDIAAPTTQCAFASQLFGTSAESIYLSPAPIYHSAPLRWCMTVQRLGGTVVLMEKFEPEAFLAAVERWRVTQAQCVPTHFVRLLKLPLALRESYDLSSLTVVIHAAAPCPVPIKQGMIDWLGPILWEYYASTEGNGMTLVDSPQWLAHPGTVGRAVLGRVYICDERGDPLPVRAQGLVCFEGGVDFAYHNDPQATAASYNKHGWSMLGDVGWLDEDGYLYLTDRQSFMIISGGVNIYPQEIENLLVTHPRVADAAVVGAPDQEMGEQVVAVIQPLDWSDANDAFAAELIGWTRERLSGVKTPRRIDFTTELPRHPTGKLYKRLIRDRYWGNRDSKIV